MLGVTAEHTFRLLMETIDPNPGYKSVLALVSKSVFEKPRGCRLGRGGFSETGPSKNSEWHPRFAPQLAGAGFGETAPTFQTPSKD